MLGFQEGQEAEKGCGIQSHDSIASCQEKLHLGEDSCLPNAVAQLQLLYTLLHWCEVQNPGPLLSMLEW